MLRRVLTSTFAILVALLMVPQSILAHCQIPCGIYGDQMRIAMIQEHITTIEKSMNQIEELSQNPTQNMNQIVRWVSNKEDHSNELNSIVTYYFMAQRIKVPASPSGDDRDTYNKQLGLLHEIMVAAMKAKQTTDQLYITQLRNLTVEFAKSYFSGEDFQHLKEHHGVGGE